MISQWFLLNLTTYRRTLRVRMILVIQKKNSYQNPWLNCLLISDVLTYALLNFSTFFIQILNSLHVGLLSLPKYYLMISIHIIPCLTCIRTLRRRFIHSLNRHHVPPAGKKLFYFVYFSAEQIRDLLQRNTCARTQELTNAIWQGVFVE